MNLMKPILFFASKYFFRITNFSNLFFDCLEWNHIKRIVLRGSLKQQKCDINVHKCWCPWTYLKNLPKELELNGSQQDFRIFVDADMKRKILAREINVQIFSPFLMFSRIFWHKKRKRKSPYSGIFYAVND